MSDSATLERFLDHLRRRGFEVLRDTATDDYLISEQGGVVSHSARRLTADSTLLNEYFDDAYGGWDLPPGSVDRGEEILSLMVTRLEAALTSVDTDGRNYVTELGLRRNTSGSVEWYQIEDSTIADQPARESQPDPDLRWVAERPPAAPDSGDVG